MKRLIALCLAMSTSLILAESVKADGDIEAGTALFKKCAVCHMIKNDSGEILVTGGRVGPNLYQVVGRQAGSIEGYAYSRSVKQLGKTGFKWDERQITKWLIDPKKYLRGTLNDRTAKSKMVFKINEGGADIAAFLASIK